MPRIVGYARVSTGRQEAEGLSLETQERRLREAGATDVLVDVMSGAKDARPQFRELLRMVRDREVDEVIVCKLDRLTRSITARAELYQAFTEPGAPTLRALDDGIDLSKAAGRQVFDLLGALATGERERIRERIKDGLAERERRGLLVGQCPWGLRLTRTGAGVEIDPDVEPTVREVLRILESSQTFGIAIRRIAAELGIKKSRSVWRTWLLSPQLSGGIPKGCRDQIRRVYDEIRPAAFLSYLNPVEQEELIARFSGEARGRRSTYPHPTRRRVHCGVCGKTLQRRNDREGRPRWLNCTDVHCPLRGRTISISTVLDALTRAAFHFSRSRLEAAVVAKQARECTSGPSPREAELLATLTALRALPQDVVADAVAKAERELAGLRQSQLAQQGIDTVDLTKAVDLMTWVSAMALQEPTPEDLKRLGELYRLAGVTVSTREGTQVKCGRLRLEMDRAQAFGKSVPVADLPTVPDRGVIFQWRDLVAALRALG